MTKDVQENLENLVITAVLDPKVIRGSLWGVMVHLETRGLLETSGPQDLLDLKGILEDLVSLGVRVRKDAKEMQVIRGCRVNKVWSVLQVQVVVPVVQDFLVTRGLMVLQDRREALDLKVLQDRWDSTDWMD